jgi:Thrombospondin type 3 repeat
MAMALLALIMGVAAAPALACPEDTDGDGVCDALDNCPAIANADQANLDGDAIGNVCDDVDAELNLTKLELKLDSSVNNDSSLYRGKGDFITSPPVDQLTAVDGFSVRLQDALGTNAAYTWAPAQCLTASSGKIICVSADKNAKLNVKPIKATPQVFKFVFKVRRVGLLGPFDGPVDVTLANGAIDRFATISDCRVSNRGLICREF